MIKQLKWILGPCVWENYSHTRMMIEKINKIMGDREWTFKVSFDKANRTSKNSYRGIDIIDFRNNIENLKKELNFKITTDIHEPWQVDVLKDVIDVWQIPAFLCRQTDLILAASNTMKPVNIKKGQFLSPKECEHIINKVKSTGNKKVSIIERGFVNGYNDLIVDMRSFPIIKQFGIPIIFDATHSVQQPGSSNITGGQKQFSLPLAKAAIAAGADGIFAEVHNDPDNSPSDSATIMNIKKLKQFIEECEKIHEAV